MSGRRARTGRAQTGGERLELRRPLLIEPPAAQQEQLLGALRTLFRDYLEDRLAFSPQSSVDPTSMDVERGR